MWRRADRQDLISEGCGDGTRREHSNQFLAPARGGGKECFDGVLPTRLGIMKKYVRKTVSSIWNVGNWMYLTGKFWEVIGN